MWRFLREVDLNDESTTGSHAVRKRGARYVTQLLPTVDTEHLFLRAGQVSGPVDLHLTSEDE